MADTIQIGSLKVYQDKPLGSGQFGSTFKGVFQKMIQVVVSLVNKDEFQVNVDILSKAQNHPNILRFFCSEDKSQFQFIATELNAGTLNDLVLGDYKGPEINIKKCLCQITKGLEYLHVKKIFHRELKPSNVFISHSDGTLRPSMKLGNFGVYKKGDGKSLFELSLSKSWMPPETHEKFTFTAAMDQFALGLLFGYTLSRGRHPYGDDEEIRVSRIKKKEPMRLTVQHLKDVKDPADVFQLISSLLSLDPSQRPSASAVLKHNFFGKIAEAETESISIGQVESSTALAEMSNLSSPSQETRKRKKNDSAKESAKRNKKEEKKKEKESKKIKKVKEEKTSVKKTRVGPSGDASAQDTSFGTSTGLFCGDPRQEPKQVNHQSSALEEELLKLSSQRNLDATQMLRFREIVTDPSINVDCKTRYGETPLLLLCTRNQSDSLLPALQALLRRKDVNIEATYWGYNALNLLIRFYNKENLFRCASLLISRGIRVVDADGLQPLLIVCHFYSGEDLIDVCRLLVRKMPKDNSSIILKSALILAERGLQQESEILEKMTQRQPSELNEKERELLALCSQLSADTCTFNRIEYLARCKDVDVNKTTSSCHRTPLQLLFHYNRGNTIFPCLQALLKRKSVDLDVTDEAGNTVLSNACFHRRDGKKFLKLVALLINHGVDVNKTNNKGWNAILALLCRPKHKGNVPDLLEIVCALINAGADLKFACKDGSNVLTALGTNYNTHPDFFAVLRLLIQHGANVNAVGFKKQNILSIICFKYKEEDFVDIVRFLLKCDVETNKRDGLDLKPVDILLGKRGFSKDSEVVRIIQDTYKMNPRV